MSWLRLDAMTFQDRNVRRSGRAGRLVFLAAMTMTKAHIWVDEQEQRGFLPDKDFTPEEIAVWYGEVGDEALKFFATGIASCLSEGLIERCRGGYRIPNWRRYQPDPTAASRQAEKRRRDGTVNGTVNSTGHSDTRDKPRQPRTHTGQFQRVTGNTVSHDDGTGRDGTKSQVTSPSTQKPSQQRGVAGDGGSGPGASAAPAPAPPSNGHLSPEENRKRLAEVAALIAPEKPRIAPEEFEARRTASLRALAGKEPQP